MLPRQLFKAFFNLFIICLLLLNSSCTKSNFYEKKFLIYGTILEFKFFQTPKKIADEAMSNVIAQLNELNSIFHPWQNSLIEEFNNNPNAINL
jgi:thiamine biosynthesis lipoprotein